MKLGDGDLHAGKYNMALMRRAIKERWPISEEIRKEVMEQMAKIATGERVKVRDRVSAAKVLVAADGVNVRREANDIQDKKPEAPVGPLVNLQFVQAIQGADDTALSSIEAKLDAIIARKPDTHHEPSGPSGTGEAGPGDNPGMASVQE